MAFKRIIIPILGLFVLANFSFAQKKELSFKPDGAYNLVCNFEDGERLEMFQVMKKYIKAGTADGNYKIKACCASQGRSCLLNRTDEGNSLAHIAAYYGNDDVLKWAVKAGFPKEEWQLVDTGFRRYRTGLMFSAENNHKSTAELLVETLKAPVQTKNQDLKDAYQIAVEAKASTGLIAFLSQKLAFISPADIKGATQAAARETIALTFTNKDSFDKAIESIKTMDIFKGVERMLKDGNYALGASLT